MPKHPDRSRTRGFAAPETGPRGLAARAALIDPSGRLDPADDRQRRIALSRAERRLRAEAGGRGYDLVRHAALMIALDTTKAARTARPRPVEPG